MKRLWLFLAVACCCCWEQLVAQSPYSYLGTWNILNVKVDLDDNWSLFLEPQVRSLRFYDHFHYYELKGGINRRLSPTFTVGGGIGRYDTYREGGDFVTPKANQELRTWLQVQMHLYLTRIRFEHRYRAEQRWTSAGYRNRFRYRLNMIVPVNRSKIEPGTFYTTVWNEIFFTNRGPYFERNRFFIGGGYEFSPFFTLQSGWVHQFDYRINDETGRDFLQLSLLFELDGKKLGREILPRSEE